MRCYIKNYQSIVLLLSVYVVSLLVICSCSHHNDVQSEKAKFSQIIVSVTNSEYIAETGAAHEALIQLFEQDDLPGVTKDEEGELTCDMPHVIISNKMIEVTYPASRTFHLVKIGSSSTNYYLLGKPTKDSKWQLKRAWETDLNGQIIKEWQIK